MGHPGILRRMAWVRFVGLYIMSEGQKTENPAENSMRTVILGVLMMISAVAHAQCDIWEQVNPEHETPQLRSVTPTNAELQAVALLLRGDDKDDVWECEG